MGGAEKDRGGVAAVLETGLLGLSFSLGTKRERVRHVECSVQVIKQKQKKVFPKKKKSHSWIISPDPPPPLSRGQSKAACRKQAGR